MKNSVDVRTKELTYIPPIELPGTDTMIIEVEPNLEERLEAMKTQNELALAELAEVILGGMD